MVAGAALLFCLTLAGTPPAADDDCEAIPDEVYPVETRTFDLPICVRPERKAELQTVVLYVSTDEGKTWDKVTSVPVGEKAFRYTAPHDGLYWFTVQVICRDGTKEPGKVKGNYNVRRVMVQTRTGGAGDLPGSVRGPRR